MRDASGVEAWGAAQDQRAPAIEVSPMGNTGNRMIQYMAALALAARVPGVRLAKIHLPEWGIQIAPLAPDLAQNSAPAEIVTSAVLDLDRLAHALNTGALQRVDIRSYAQDMRNFLPPAAYRGIFPSPSVRGAGPRELLCNIRQGDILDAHHPDYVLLPIDFYAELLARTGLSPVFMGQLDESPYLAALRRRFPAARYVPSQGGVADFAFIRASCHIVPAISTFSWLAAWLSEAESVHMPVLGLFNPAQARTTHLLPFDDARYHFTAFPHHYAVPVAGFEAAHAALRPFWRQLPGGALQSLLARAPPPRDTADTLAAFDEASYLAIYPDVAAVVAAGHMPSGRHHFEFHGLAEGREAFGMDRAAYCTAYPIAAFEMAVGDALSPADHWVRLGRGRGYERWF